MKGTCAAIAAIMLTVLLFTACKKDDPDTIFNVSFYTGKANGRLVLYMDDVQKGELPYFSGTPACGQAGSDGQQPLTAQLRSGEYRIAGKNDQGETTSYGTIKLSKSTIGTSGGIGGMSFNSNGDCVVIGLFE